MYLLKSQRGSSGLVEIIGKKYIYFEFKFLVPFPTSACKDIEYTYLSETENFTRFKYFKKENNA